ncbi:MAG: SLC13 family permease [Luteolibacter sp.]
MTRELLLVLGLLAAAIAMFVMNRPRMDVVALLMILLLPCTGVIRLNEALAGFSDPNVILIAVLFVVGEALVRTGVAFQMGEFLMKRAGSSEFRLMALLMASVIVLGSVMSSTGVVAIFIPVVLTIVQQRGISPRKLMMPLSFAGLISGMQTLVATAPNLVVDGALRDHGHAGFGFFSFTPIGLVVAVLGVGYMAFARRWLEEKKKDDEVVRERRKLRDYVSDYALGSRGFRMRILPHSGLVGKTLAELTPRSMLGANVIAIERIRRLVREMVHPQAKTVLRAGDVLFVDMTAAPDEEKRGWLAKQGVEVMPVSDNYFHDETRELGMAEVLVPPTSRLIHESIVSSRFRSRHGLHVVGLKRGVEPLASDPLHEKLKAGDTLLVAGPWRAIRRLQTNAHDFVVLSLPAEIEQVAPAASKAPFAIFSLLVMVVLMMTGAVPNVAAGLIACLLFGAFRCVTMDAAYRSIHWQSLILIIGMMPFSLALERTGGISLAADALAQWLGNASPHLTLAALFVVTSILSMFVSNTATAVLMAPFALKLAEVFQANPQSFVMIVAISASASFLTPVSSPVNMLVMGPGRYKFFDFVKIGLPFTLLVMVVCVAMVPLLFPW